MEQFHWTERQLMNDNSFAMMRKISSYNEIRNLAQKEAERKQEREARSR